MRITVDTLADDFDTAVNVLRAAYAGPDTSSAPYSTAWTEAGAPADGEAAAPAPAESAPAPTQRARGRARAAAKATGKSTAGKASTGGATAGAGRVGRQSSTGRAGGSSERPSTGTVRAWARQNGVQVPSRGRVSDAVFAQYAAAQQGQ